MQEPNGWIKLHRKTLNNPIVMKDANHLAVWVYLLLNATHDDYSVIFKGERTTLKAGQLITGRKSIAQKLGINESTVRRILDEYENDHQISQQMSNKNRLISILNWSLYQQNDQQNDHQVTNNRPTSDHKQEYKEQKNIYNMPKSKTKNGRKYDFDKLEKELMEIHEN